MGFFVLFGATWGWNHSILQSYYV